MNLQNLPHLGQHTLIKIGFGDLYKTLHYDLKIHHDPNSKECLKSEYTSVQNF